MEDLHNSTGTACPDLPTLLAWHANQIEGADAGTLKHHIDACAHCQAFLAGFPGSTTGGARPELVLIPSPEPDESSHPLPTGAGTATRARAHLKLISSHGAASSSPSAPIESPRVPVPEPRPVSAPPPWQPRIDARPSPVPPPVRSPGSSRMAGAHTPIVPPGAGSNPLTPARDGHLPGDRRMGRPEALDRSALSNPWLAAGASLLITLLLLYPAWLGLVRLPLVEERLQTVAVPHALGPVVALRSEPADRVPGPSLLPETPIDGSLPYVVLELTVPDPSPGARHELALTDSRQVVVWNQIHLQSQDGTIQLLISPRALGEGSFTVRTVTTAYGQVPKIQLARFRIDRPPQP